MGRCVQGVPIRSVLSCGLFALPWRVITAGGRGCCGGDNRLLDAHLNGTWMAQCCGTGSAVLAFPFAVHYIC